MSYHDVKHQLPPIGKKVRVFFETKSQGGHGLWWEGTRVSETCFQLGSNNDYLSPIDISDRRSLGVGTTHWADLDETNLPNLCRLHNGNCG